MKLECGRKLFLLRVTQSITDYFGSQLKTIASKRTREERGKRQITKIVINAKTWLFVSQGLDSTPKDVRPSWGGHEGWVFFNHFPISNGHGDQLSLFHYHTYTKSRKNLQRSNRSKRSLAGYRSELLGSCFDLAGSHCCCCCQIVSCTPMSSVLLPLEKLKLLSFLTTAMNTTGQFAVPFWCWLFYVNSGHSPNSPMHTRQFVVPLSAS
jgi:hypothetical protein